MPDHSKRLAPERSGLTGSPERKSPRTDEFVDPEEPSVEMAATNLLPGLGGAFPKASPDLKLPPKAPAAPSAAAPAAEGDDDVEIVDGVGMEGSVVQYFVNLYKADALIGATYGVEVKLPQGRKLTDHRSKAIQEGRAKIKAFVDTRKHKMILITDVAFSAWNEIAKEVETSENSFSVVLLSTFPVLPLGVEHYLDFVDNPAMNGSNPRRGFEKVLRGKTIATEYVSIGFQAGKATHQGVKGVQATLLSRNTQPYSYPPVVEFGNSYDVDKHIGNLYSMLWVDINNDDEDSFSAFIREYNLMPGFSWKKSKSFANTKDARRSLYTLGLPLARSREVISSLADIAVGRPDFCITSQEELLGDGIIKIEAGHSPTGIEMLINHMNPFAMTFLPSPRQAFIKLTSDQTELALKVAACIINAENRGDRSHLVFEIYGPSCGAWELRKFRLDDGLRKCLNMDERPPQKGIKIFGLPPGLEEEQVKGIMVDLLEASQTKVASTQVRVICATSRFGSTVPPRMEIPPDAEARFLKYYAKPIKIKWAGAKLSSAVTFERVVERVDDVKPEVLDVTKAQLQSWGFITEPEVEPNDET